MTVRCIILAKIAVMIFLFYHIKALHQTEYY